MTYKASETADGKKIPADTRTLLCVIKQRQLINERRNPHFSQIFCFEGTAARIFVYIQPVRLAAPQADRIFAPCILTIAIQVCVVS
jgi:hypothetical protein